MTYWESVKQTLGSAYCSVSGFGAWYTAQVSSITDGTQLEGIANFQEKYAKAANTYFCGKDPDSPSGIFPPPRFTGGQCVGLAYGINLSISYSDIPNFSVNIGNGGEIIGSIVSIDVSENGKITVVHNSGASTYTSDGRNVSVVGWSVINLYTPFGGVDNCGDREESGLSPTNQPFSHTKDVAYTDENGNPRTADGTTFEYDLPFFNPDGTITIPYEVCWEGFCLTGDIEVSGDGFSVVPKLPLSPTNQSNLPTLQEIEELLDSKDRADEIIDELKEKIDEVEVFASVPEAYQIRIESGRKQLIVMYAEKFKDSKGKMQYARNRLAQSIPHWNGSKNWKNLPIWTRGNCWGKAILNDNSKVYVLADSEISARSVVNRLLNFIDSSVRNGAIVATGKIEGRTIAKRKAFPKYARYFPQGQNTRKDDVVKYEINL